MPYNLETTSALLAIKLRGDHNQLTQNNEPLQLEPNAFVI